MKLTDSPKKQPVPFAINGLREDLLPSSPSGENTASYLNGFPPITMTLKAAGGLPPKGQDMNQILYELSSLSRWASSGSTNSFDADFSSRIGGYPKGAIVPSSVYTGQWLNLNEENGTSPESSLGANTGWVPINNYGITSISGLTSTSITLSSLQAAKDRIILTGSLTGNINLIFPAWIKSWVIQNNCTGNFAVTCKTASGSGVQVVSGLTSRIFCDGVNISDETFNSNNDMVGAVLPFAMNMAPSGWLVCNGQEVSRTKYARLFSRIGIIYGNGDGSTTFKVPDMRGEFVRGVDSGRVIGSTQGHAIQNITGSVANVLTQNPNAFDGVLGFSGTGFMSLTTGGDAVQFRNITIDASKTVQTASETRPRNIALLYCIKF